MHFGMVLSKAALPTFLAIFMVITMVVSEFNWDVKFAGLQILAATQDQVWPKKCGHMRGKAVVPAEEHATKIAAARDAIGDSDFFLVARTDARAPHGLQEGIRRAKLYRDVINDFNIYILHPFHTNPMKPDFDDPWKCLTYPEKGKKIINAGFTAEHSDGNLEWKL